ncbi:MULTISPECIES: glycosyltransferase family 2 protein [Rhodomicrobium]|uniref:glycosyltransferase family 2 protein n=1 Tax=Rhodomicrobium TaxID=1068 RepID=UPI000F73FC9F|nr:MULTISPECIES: glycosyltransferase family 2 protein [Rhodomicrobium]
MGASVVCGVVLYETPVEDLRRLAQSVRVAGEAAGLPCRLAAIDNSGRTTDAAFAEAVPGGIDAELYTHRGNIGFGRGHNLLMDAAFADGASHYLACNPDGFLHADAIKAMHARSSQFDDFALIEARQFPNEHPKLYDCAALTTPWCSGACLMVPRRLHAEIGGFDDGFFMYCEDVDYSWRARLAGAACIIAPDAFFFHDVQDRPDSRFARWHMALSMKRLMSKWLCGAAPLRLTTLLAEMLYDAPDEALRAGSRAGQPLGHPRCGEVADFRHYFGFAPFRWS